MEKLFKKIITKQKTRIWLTSIFIFFIFFLFSNSDFVTLTWPSNLRMRCNYNFNLSFNLNSQSTNISNFDKLVTDFESGKVTINSFTRNNRIDTTNSQYILWANGIEVKWLFYQPRTKAETIYTTNIKTKNISWFYYTIYWKSWWWLCDQNSCTRQWPFQQYFSNIQALPCQDDNQSPVITNISPSWITNNWYRISASSWLSFQTFENPWFASAWRTWSDQSDLNNFVNIISDNQKWIDINTLTFSLSTNAIWFSYPTKTRNNTNLWSTRTSSWYWKTREYLDKNYDIQVTENLLNYWREKEMRLVAYTKDRANNWSSNYNRLFNSPDNPKIKNELPTNWTIEILPLTDISMIIRDRRAWVNKNSINVKIYNETLWNQLIWEFSWLDLLLTTTSWIADTPDYKVDIKSWQYYNWLFFRLPVPIIWSWTYQIKVVWHAVDNEWNIWDPHFSFNTRHACVYYPWCSEALEISWVYINWYVWSLPYPDTEIYTTWSNQINIDTTWQLLNCWPEDPNIYVATEITGIENTQPFFYNWEKLYIDWWKIISLNNWFLTIEAQP